MHHLRLRWTGLFAAGSILVLGTGCPDDDIQEYDVELAGENQVPLVATPASGTMDVTFDEEDDTLTISGDFEGLISRLQDVNDTPAHIHLAEQGQSGPVIYDVEVQADDDERSGTFEFEEQLTADEVDAFEDNEMYLNIHTNAYPDGELRAQLDENAPEFEPVERDWGVELTAQAQPHDVDTEADGWASVILRDDESMIVSGAADDLSGDLTEVFGSAVNIEEAETGETGDMVLNLDYEERNDDGVRFWNRADFDDDEVETLLNGNYYINVYTTEHEQGELRGQIDEEDEFFFDFWNELFDDDPDRIDEVPRF